MHNLFLIMSLKLKMKLLGVQKMEIQDREIRLVLSPTGALEGGTPGGLIRKDPETYRLKGDGRLSAARPENEPGLEGAETLLTRLQLLLE